MRWPQWGLCLLNLGIMMAGSMAKRLGVPVRAVWMDARTHRSLKDLCGSAIVACWALDVPVAWDQLSERSLEKHFGRIRSAYPNCILTASDYWRASATVMRKDDRKLNEELPKAMEMEKMLNDATFCNIAQRSFQAFLKLAGLCSGRSTSDLQAEFHRTNSGGAVEEQLDDGEDGSDTEGTSFGSRCVF